MTERLPPHKTLLEQAEGLRQRQAANGDGRWSAKSGDIAQYSDVLAGLAAV